MMKPVYLTLLVLVPFISYVSSTTTSLVLNNANNVVAGQSATYNCSSDGNGVNPTIQWSIRTTDGTVVRSNAQLSSTVVSGASVDDGAIKSSVTFTVQSSYLTNHRLWCSAVDAGQSSATMQIYTAISATTTTTASLGGTCSSSTTCSTANAGCVSNVCRCNTNYYDTNGDNNSGGSCSLQVGLGGTCTAGIDASCYTNNARCSSTSPYTCVCSSGYVQSGSSCVADSAFLGESCVSPTRTCLYN
ncbi:uncharacterized protein LOC132753591 [Ruditapes philippinarum]|uniref:uncharacterized protein LOC132753591 n=1 Tax=Ruditapes philippinarum TaxID=129788 RepID=UPI00295C1AE1|nr:uncharacterized protein LOC132753591 [Ruditapes philippinarum]XP_060600059.1 uncharacterized protein LOC132753591 [Ruditapes philippinarum]